MWIFHLKRTMRNLIIECVALSFLIKKCWLCVMSVRHIIIFRKVEWLEFDRLKEVYFYPLFIKEKIRKLPKSFPIITTYE